MSELHTSNVCYIFLSFWTHIPCSDHYKMQIPTRNEVRELSRSQVYNNPYLK